MERAVKVFKWVEVAKKPVCDSSEAILGKTDNSQQNSKQAAIWKSWYFQVLSLEYKDNK